MFGIKINAEKLGHLPAEVKVKIVEGMNLVEQTREAAKGHGFELGLTGKAQLRDDCNAIELCIEKLYKKNYKEKHVKALELAIIRLQTTARALLGLGK